MVKEPQVVFHEADQPDLVGHLLDPDGLAGEDGRQIDLRRWEQVRPHWVTVMVWSQKG